MQGTISIHIIVVNFETAKEVRSCFERLHVLRARNSIAFTASILDNGSADDSVERLQEMIESLNLSGWVDLICHAENVGFGAGNNLVLEECLNKDVKPDYFFLLNPDTEIFPDSFDSLLEFLSSRVDIDICGLGMEYADGRPQHSAFTFPGVLGVLDDCLLKLGIELERLSRYRMVPLSKPTDTCMVDWIAGGSMLIRTEVLQRIGLFDEAFFLYFEEVDFCKRAHDARFRTWYYPHARLIHHRGRSTGVTGSDAHLRKKPAYWYHSRAHYWKKHHTVGACVLSDVIFLLLYPLILLRSYAGRLEMKRTPCHWRLSLWYGFLNPLTWYKLSSRKLSQDAVKNTDV